DPPRTDFFAGAAAGGIHLAGQPSTTPGLVLDYISYVEGSYSNFTFASYSAGSGPTYVVEGGWPTFVWPGTVTFQANCVIKFRGATGLCLYGFIQCQGTQDNPSVLTSYRDSQYGDIVDTGVPAAGDIGTGLYIYYACGSCPTLSGLVIRYATNAIEWAANCFGTTCTIANCAFYDCTTGLYADGANVVIQNSAVNTVTYPVTLFGCQPAVTGSFGQGYPPSFATSPVCQVVEQGSSVTFTAALSPPTAATYQWYGENGSYGSGGWTKIAGATGSSLTVPNVADRTEVEVFGGNPFGSAGSSSAASVVVLGNPAWTDWTTLIANTNGKTPSVWSTMRLTQPPALAWNTSSLIWGKAGYTAISQVNSWDILSNTPGVFPVTALTARHGYTRGHGMGGTRTNNPATSMTVYFCDPNNTVHQVNVLANIVRYDGVNDYTVLLFDSDLPASITPMQVASQPQGEAVQLATQQRAYPYGGVPGSVALVSPIPTYAFTPPLPFGFYYNDGGDSGSPVMVLATNSTLVFIKGTTTSGPGSQSNSPMQADMDTLSLLGNLNPANYQMGWLSIE
ncbi:MAG: immunoglobulin domain-containing protein, partial [Verrucomicrobiota bacterium]